MQKRFLFVASLIFALSIYSAVRENIFIGFLAAGILLSEIFYIIFSKLDKNKKLFLCSFIGMFLLLGILVGQRVVRRNENIENCLLYTSPSPRDAHESRMPSSA